MRLRLVAPVLIVLVLTAAGFLAARMLAERDVDEDAEHRADIAATEVRGGIKQATNLVESLRRFLLGRVDAGVTNDQFADIGARWLAPVGLPAAAWVESVPKPGQRSSALRATLVTGADPMTAPGIDLSGEALLVAAVADPRTRFRVTATPLASLRDGRRGIFLVQSAPRLSGGVLQSGFVVLFVPGSWLVSEVTEESHPALQIRVGDTSYGGLGDAAAVGSAFSAVGRRFAVLVPEEPAHGPAALLPWLILGAGLVFAALAGTLAAISERRARAQREVDRIFALSPDPITVAGFDGVWKRVNPAFESLLGYTEREARAQPYLEFVHPDDRERSAEEARRVLESETTVGFLNRIVCKDGSYKWIEWTATAVPEEGVLYGLARDVTERRQREREQAALRRVATLVAQGVQPEELFAVVAEEIGRVIDVPLVRVVRYESDDAATELASFSADGTTFPFGLQSSLEGTNVLRLVRETSEAARIDDYSELEGEIAEIARDRGIRSAVGTPIVVAGRPWGAVVASSKEQLPDDTEARLTDFTELLATAIATAEADEARTRLVDEQAALRRMATLVAEGVPPAEIFAAVCEEVGRLVNSETAAVVRFEHDPPAIVVAGVGQDVPGIPIGARSELDDTFASTEVYRTGRSARIDARHWETAGSRIHTAGRRLGLSSTVASPINVEGRLWGTISVSAKKPFAPDTEQRLERFSELVATAIANAESREAVTRLADEQAALRRVATLVAQGVRPAEMFRAVTEEVSRIVGIPAVSVVRYEADGTATELANFFTGGALFPVGVRMNIEGTNILRLVRDSAAPARIDDYSRTDGEMAETVRRAGVRSTVGIPIVVAGDLWGTMAGSTTEPAPLPDDTESRLADFTELLATAIENAESREALERLADEQAALRRVATLVARGVRPDEVFSAVSDEVGRLFGSGTAAVVRFDHDDPAIVFVGVANTISDGRPIETRWELDDSMASAEVYRTGRSARIDGTDWSTVSGAVGGAGRRLGIVSSVASPIVVEGRRWGAMTVSAQETLPLDTEERLEKFTELVATAIANTESRVALSVLADEQAALRRVATLVARGAPPTELFAAVAEEAGQLLPADSAAMGRYDPDGMFTTVAAWSTGDAAFPVGRRWMPEGKNVTTLVLETGRPARMDTFADASGPVGVAAREAGYRSAVGTPIVVEGRLWGVMTAASTAEQPLPPYTEARLASFTELVATSIANAESRAALRTIAAEQAALRRVAVLVAQQPSPDEVFTAVTEAVGRLLGVDLAAMHVFPGDGTATAIAGWSDTGPTLPIGARLSLDGDSVAARIFDTSAPARMDTYDDVEGETANVARGLHLRSTVGAPILVNGKLWGALMAATRGEEPLPEDAETRIAEFTELVATAIANAENRSELAASRARIVTASDEVRRRIERDLHDGAQQRLVSLGLELRMAESTLPPELDEPRETIGRIAGELYQVVDDLREISRGIHPAILSEGGLGPAMRALARRSAIPIEVHAVIDERLPEPIEVAAYFVASEALANAAKHAEASSIELSLATRNGSLLLSIRDDGVGGADPARGSGLVGLADRVEALGGRIEIESAPGEGTSLVVALPLDAEPMKG